MQTRVSVEDNGGGITFTWESYDTSRASQRPFVKQRREF